VRDRAMLKATQQNHISLAIRAPRLRFEAAPLESWDSSASPAKDKKDHAHHQEYNEQKLRDSR